MEPVELPPPPPPVDDAPHWRTQRPLRAGQLTPAWRVVLGLAWVGVILSLSAVWKSGRTLGLSPWWLGPSGDPNLFIVELLPFAFPVAMVLGTIRNLRYLPYAGIVASLAVGGVAAGDLSRFSGVAAIEMAAAGAGLLASLAAFAGLLREIEPDAVTADGAVKVAPVTASRDPAEPPPPITASVEPATQ